VILLCAVPPRIVSSESSSLVVREGDSVSLSLLCDDIWQCVILLCAVPPRIVSSESSSLVVREGDNVSLSCEASGYPPPHIVWRREDGDDILIGGRKVMRRYPATIRRTI
jgi:hypothetical protein